MGKIKVIIKRPDEVVGHVTNISNTLENLQKTVGGYIETLTLMATLGVVLIMNEEGYIRGLEPNFQIGASTIRGTVIVAGVDGDELADVPLELSNWKTILELWGNKT